MTRLIRYCNYAETYPFLEVFCYFIKDTLYAEINMLGHDDLRNELAKAVKDKFIEKYQEMLEKIGKEKMDNEEVKNFCKENKINLNKFGKNSSQICIYSV